MTVVGLFWPDLSGADLHLVPGFASPELFKAVLVSIQDAAGKITAERLFTQDATIARKITPALNNPAAHGIQIDATTGEVSVTGAALAGRSFNVLIEASDKAPGTGKASIRIRIHVHAAITRLWLNPQPLTVRLGTGRNMFGVVAEFTDRSAGDLSNWSPFTTTDAGAGVNFVHATTVVGPAAPALTWQAMPARPGSLPVSVDPATGVITAPADHGQGDVKVTCAAGALVDTAQVNYAPGWATPVTLTQIAGPGTGRMTAIPNILFLPDGFTRDDRKAFEKYLGVTVNRLQTRNRTRPYEALTGRINYWMAWVESREAGVSVLPELFQDPLRHDPAAGVLQATEVELPSGNSATAAWSLEDFIEGVGLPVPNDPEGGTLAGNTGHRVNDWVSIYPDATPARAGAVAFTDWNKRKPRRLLDERDTAFHQAFGERPAISPFNVFRSVTTNPKRMVDGDLNSFLAALKGPDGKPMTDLAGAPLWTTGKDRNLVVIICRSSHAGGTASFRTISGTVTGRTIALSLADRDFHRFKQAGGVQADLEPDTIPTDVFFSVWLTTAHELAHVFGLADEYTEFATPPSAEEIAESASEPNVQDAASVKTDTPFGTVLTVDKIKWAHWPRIAKAAVLVAQPNRITATQFGLVLRDLGKPPLAAGDVVRLRKRPLVTAGLPSPRFLVDSVSTGSDTLTMTQLEGEPITPDHWPQDSIVMAPVRAPDPNRAGHVFGAELTLTDPDVLNRITITGNPLNAHPLATETRGDSDPPNRPDPGTKLALPTEATNFRDGDRPKRPVHSSWNIGLYENGRRHNSGFYRPTGICLMAAQTSGEVRPKNLYDFCIVCRYALVDQVDPTAHGAVESDFRDRYGPRGAGA